MVVFQNYVKTSLEYIIFRVKEISTKVEGILESRQNYCACSLTQNEAVDEQFQFPLDSFDAIDHLERRLNDFMTSKQLVIVCLKRIERN